MTEYCIYSITLNDYDHTFGPLAYTPKAEFLRFGNWKPEFGCKWQLMSIPNNLEDFSPTLINRYLKIHPKAVAPNAEVCVYVDGNILIKNDLTPIIEEFRASNADIALFPHPSKRTVAEELEFAVKVGRIKPEQQQRVVTQHAKYARTGTLTEQITENSIVFYNMKSDKIDAISAAWWDELICYTHRDQICLPYVINSVIPRVKFWDWHFNDRINPYFSRYPHKHGSQFRIEKRKANFLKNFSIRYAIKFQMLRAFAYIRRAF